MYISWIWERLLRYPKEMIGVTRKGLLYLRKGRLKTAIFGLGGTGKTTLGEFMMNGLAAAGSPKRMSESGDVESHDLNTPMYLGELVIAPGQDRRIEDHWPTLMREIDYGEIQIIIYTCSYGYHSFRDESYRRHRLYRSNMSKDEFVRTYQRECLQAETKIFREYLYPAIKAAPGCPLLLLALTKADLWWDQRTRVEAHYRDGELGKLIDQLRKERGNGRLIVERANICMRLENLVTEKGEILVSTCAGYDDFRRKGDFDKFFGIVGARSKAFQRLKW